MEEKKPEAGAAATADEEKAQEAAQEPKAQKAPAATPGADDAPSNLRLILDIPLEVSVELGRSKILVKDLLKLGQGSIVELDKMMDEPMEILVNQKRVARGEVVVSNDKFGVRLTDIIDPIERLEKLQ